MLALWMMDTNAALAASRFRSSLSDRKASSAALRRSRSMSRSMFSRIAIFAARWQISVRSAPVYFSVFAARKSRSAP